MNYRHAFHAGNFADVLKHAVLALVIEYLKQKPTPFRVIDTHAGAGVYDLGADAATRTGEWRDGIGRLLGPRAAHLPAEVCTLLRPYLEVVRSLNPAGDIARYPGSPSLALALLRGDDRLIATELHPEDRAHLAASLGRDRRAKVLGIDGWQALKALLPPKERRGVVLIDPPFEQEGEFERLARGLAAALARFAGGIYLLWHPNKDPATVGAFRRQCAAFGGDRLLAIDLDVGARAESGRLRSTGLLVVNPPFRLEAQLALLLPALAAALSQGAGSGYACRRIAAQG